MQNLLPFNGEARNFGVVFEKTQADSHFAVLLAETPWVQDEGVIFGKPYKTARKMAFYGDKPYHYAQKTHHALPFSAYLQQIKSVIEALTGATYNACLLNLYIAGSQGMGWHSDDEKEIVPRSTIASVSFGARRRFDFRHKTSGETVQTWLEAGSLLTMAGDCQTFWKHQLPKSTRVNTPRINLTFRTMF